MPWNKKKNQKFKNYIKKLSLLNTEKEIKKLSLLNTEKEIKNYLFTYCPGYNKSSNEFK